MKTKRLITLIALMLFVFVGCMANKRKALVVGISRYDTSTTWWNPIHGANDVALMKKALKGFDTEVLLDERATFKNIEAELSKLIKRAGRGDVIYIHLSGHGQPYEDLNGDETDGWDESFVPYDAQQYYAKGRYEGAKHLTDDILHNYVERLRRKVGRTGIVYVSIDACHSGDSYRGDGDDDDEGMLIEDRFIESLPLVREDVDEENYARGSACGFSPNGKTYDVTRSRARRSNRIASAPDMSKVVYLESSLSTEASLELKLYVKGSDGIKRNFYCGLLSYSIYKVLTSSGKLLGSDTSWISSVRPIFEKMRQPNNLQQLVIESTY